jgi:hypothetical protein
MLRSCLGSSFYPVLFTSPRCSKLKIHENRRGRGKDSQKRGKKPERAADSVPLKWGNFVPRTSEKRIAKRVAHLYWLRIMDFTIFRYTNHRSKLQVERHVNL